MELRRSARIAEKRAKQNIVFPIDNIKDQMQTTFQKKSMNTKGSFIAEEKENLAISEKFVNFVVYGLFKVDVEDPKAEAVKKRVTDFYQLFIFFCAIKFVFWYLDVLQYK